MDIDGMIWAQERVESMVIDVMVQNGWKRLKGIQAYRTLGIKWIAERICEMDGLSGTQ